MGKRRKEITYINATDPSEVMIDFEAIPAFIRDDIAATTLECVRDFLRQPGGREFLDARIAAEKAKNKTESDGS